MSANSNDLRPAYRRLPVRITAGILLIAAACFAPASAVVYFSVRDFLRQSLIDQAGGMAEAIAESSVEPLRKYNYWALQNLALKVENLPPYLYCQIYDAGGRALADVDANLAGERVAKKPPPTGGNVALITRPIIADGTTLGRVELAVNLEGARAEALRQGALLIGTLAISLAALAIALNYFLNRRIISPVLSLSELSHELALGRFARSDLDRLDNEVGDLARDFNEMSRRLGELYGDLTDSAARFQELLECARELAFIRDPFAAMLRAARTLAARIPLDSAARASIHSALRGDADAGPGYELYAEPVRFEGGHRAPVIDFRSVEALTPKFVAELPERLERLLLNQEEDLPLRDERTIYFPCRFEGRVVGLVTLEGAAGFDEGEYRFAAAVHRSLSAALQTIYAADRLELAVRQRTAELSAANERLHQTMRVLWSEMELARKIQTALVPQDPRVRGLRISASMQPAKEVGGDYFDVIETDSCGWLLIGDVSGKGVPAGLIMMMTQTTVRALIARDPDCKPSDLLKRLDAILRENIRQLQESRYLTITAVRYDADGSFTYSGLHLDFFIHRAASNEFDRMPTRGFWLGAFTDFTLLEELKDDTGRLEPGDTLVLYTDGITEATLPDGALLGEDGMLDILRDYLPGDPERARVALVEAVRRNKISDDLTILLAKRVT